MWNIDYFNGVSSNLWASVPAIGDSYWKSNTMFDLEYCNWNKDLFMGILPDTQFGDVATIPFSGDSVVPLMDLSVTPGRLS